MTRVIGLMSGTSADGIDAALVDIVGTVRDLNVELVAAATVSYPLDLRDRILAVIGGSALTLEEVANLDEAIAYQFARAAVMIQQDHTPAELIGSHGQTVFHRSPRPNPWRSMERYPAEVALATSTSATSVSANSSLLNMPSQILGYSLQLGRGSLIADLTGIPTISNFRAADIALGGEGAPLVPIVDACLLRHASQTRCVQNIGGIGNVAYLPTLADDTDPFISIRGWDTGPGNTLIDLAVQHFSKGEKAYDEDGAWAARGTPCQALIRRWLKQDYFQKPPPKSTGREEFGVAYLRDRLVEIKNHGLSRSDAIATLTELTAASIAHSYYMFLPQMPDQVLVCGGGSKNTFLRHRLQVYLEPVTVLTTDDVGLNAEFKEAIAFAVLAYWRQQGIPGNLPKVTGARHSVPLGEMYQPQKQGVIP